MTEKCLHCEIMALVEASLDGGGSITEALMHQAQALAATLTLVEPMAARAALLNGMPALISGMFQVETAGDLIADAEDSDGPEDGEALH